MRVAFENIVNGVIDGVNKIIDAFNKLTGLDMGKLGRIGSSMTLPTNAASSGQGLSTSGLNYTPALSYASAGANYSKNVNITNNNNFSSNSDTNSFAKYQAWQITGR